MTNEEFIKKLSEMENTLPISNELANLMDYITNKLSKELPTLTIDLDYFILGVFSQKDNFTFKRLTDSLTSSSIDAIYSSYYQVISSKALTAIKIGRKITIDNLFSELFIKAMEEARSLGDEVLTSEHIFLSILAYDNENNKTKKVFNKAGITYSIFKSKLEDKFNNITENNSSIIPKVKIIGNIENEEEARKIIQTLFNSNDNIEFLDHNSLPGMPKLKKGKDVHIKTYCTNLNDLAEQGKIGPLIGRDKEINEIIRILGRKKKNNTILLGGEGVGKTVIGESLALKIVNNEVPDFLSKRILVSLDMTALMAGTTLRGMFEERVKGILDEIKANPNYILFMDNIGAILADKGKNDYEISSMLARSLENGEIQVIGTSDFISYRKTFDKDPSLARRFQKIIVETPTIEESLKIIYGLKASYEDFHNVEYLDEAIDTCVYLADKYIPERNLPDSAIDIIDEVGSLKGTIIEPTELKDLRDEIKILNAKVKALTKANDFEQADFFSKEIKNIQKKYNNIKKEFDKNRKDNPPIINKDDILEIISVKTNIPVNNLTADDKKKLVDMNDRIKSNVIGQNEAIDTICRALKRNRIGLHSGKCMYSAMMLGPTGVGKTLIAKQLAKELFGDEKALVRFDMSEFSDKTSVHKLTGCFTPDMKVLMADGSYKNINEVEINDEVITPNGNIKKVLNKYEYDFNGLLDNYRIANNNQKIRCTPNHELFTIKSSFYKNGRFKKESYNYKNANFTESKNVNEKDISLYPRHIFFERKDVEYDLYEFIKHLPSYEYDNDYIWSSRFKNIKLKRFIKFDSSLARLIGYYVSEGGVSKNYKTITFSFNINETEYVNEVIYLMNNIFNFSTYHIRKNEKRHNCVLTFSNRAICYFLAEICGRYVYEKKIPKDIFNLSKNEQVNFIETAFFGDGTKSSNNATRYTTTSFKLGEQIVTLLRNLGYNAQIQITKHKNNNYHKTFYIYLTGGDIDMFNNNMPSLKIKRYNSGNKNIKRNYHIDNKFFYNKIISKNNEYYNGKVYDLTIEDDSCYIVNTMSVHNSNPGYVGYEEGGQLTETIKNRKHCVLLLDEIEKADPEIYNIFLQVLDEGFLTDNSGMKVDFKNVIVLFTSNNGAKAASDFGKGIGFNENEDDNKKRILLKQLKNKFPPEFLNRLNDIIYFNSLNNDNLKEIIKIEIEKLNKRVNNIGYKIEYDENVLDFILEKIRDESEFGARPIMRAIQDNIEDKITDTLLENTYNEGHVFKISCCSDLSEIKVA